MEEAIKKLDNWLNSGRWEGEPNEVRVLLSSSKIEDDVTLGDLKSIVSDFHAMREHISNL